VVDFVNPYTFVPHVEAPSRRPPSGHDRLRPGGFSGQLTLRITAKTPLLVGSLTSPGDEGHDAPRGSDGTVILPGSGLHGAIRSVHEALTGSCLRVLNAQYVPVHRDPAQANTTAGLKLAMVVELDEHGLPSWVALCEREVGIEKGLLAGHACPLRTGDRLRLPEDKFEPPENGKRPLLRPVHAEHGNAPLLGAKPADIVRMSGMHADVDGTWVLLMTDTRARSESNRAWFVAGQVGRAHRAVSVGARAKLSASLEGVDDRGPASLAGAPADDPGFVDVLWPPPQDANAMGRVIGQRLRVSGRLHVGQPVWVRHDGVQVTDIRLSQLWRHQGSGSVGERVGDAAPCTDPNNLCPSCRLFGSADPNSRGVDDVARQSSYRGHVRIDDAGADAEVTTTEWELAPLSSPRPSAGQFYLDHSGVDPQRQLARNNSEPAAFWGSDADTSSSGLRLLRPIRGRKFYWRTTAPTQGDHPRGRKRPHHSDQLTRTVRLIPQGSHFTARLTFDGLTRAQLGGLVVAIDPRHLWPGVNVVTSVGGGRPFGFGAVTTDIVLDRLESAGERYLGDAAVVPTLGECVAAFRDPSWTGQAGEGDPESAGADAQGVWAALRNALTLGFVSDAEVWYPPGTGHKGSEEFDRGFDFWKGSAGIEIDHVPRRLVCPPLPEMSKDDQVLRSTGAQRARGPNGGGAGR
jgi:hypothetical protein